jgi:hypothetical protein|tara:strand:- start:278 stop:379 length:102 start_codon:yes stop_codon:yes gene_type:complete
LIGFFVNSYFEPAVSEFKGYRPEMNGVAFVEDL